MEQWILDEFSQLELGGKRLNKRCLKLFEKRSQQPSESIPFCHENWAETKAAYRFFDNKKVNSNRILELHKRGIELRCQSYHRVFVLQDTTELDYTQQYCKEGTGPVHYETEGKRLLHSNLVVNEKGLVLGVYDDYQWYRPQLRRQTGQAMKTRHNERLHQCEVSEKESYRWVLGYRNATTLAQACPKAEVIMVADREGELYDVYEEAHNTGTTNAHWLVRVKIKNRALMNESNKKESCLL